MFQGTFVRVEELKWTCSSNLNDDIKDKVIHILNTTKTKLYVLRF